MSVEPIDYEDLRSLWVKAHRNGNIRKLNLIEKALFKACIAYSKLKGRIMSRVVLENLKPTIEKLKSTPKKEALKAGFMRIHKLINGGIIKLFPKILNWIIDENYILYIGFMEINNPPYMKVDITI